MSTFLLQIHVLPDRKDPHFRKEFWLRYVNQCISRPLLCSDDRYRLQVYLRETHSKVSHFGNIIGINSAFILDFGKVVVVEFSRIGACYIYSAEQFKSEVPNIWSNNTYRETNLKNKSNSLDRIIHRITTNINWRDDAARILARYGIRPG